ncbi:O-antigen ligase family protein [Ahrensia kielensis]|uniref:O-antigen ligase family protein n=1 Tax=Ahrensia kielensis TaxID=76980 RepID=A0ABU9T815_9HYPH
MIKSFHSQFRDPVPTSYLYSALFFASVGVFASSASILVAIAGLFALWRLYITKSLKRISIDGEGLVWAAVIAYYGAGAFSAVMNPSDSESVAQLGERIPFLFLPLLLQFFSQADPDKLLSWSAKGACLGVFIVFAYWGLFDQFRVTRITALSGNSNVLGYMCCLLFVFLCLGVAGLTDKKIKLVYTIAVVLCVILVASSGSRGSLLTVVSISVIMVWLHGPWRAIWTRTLVITFMVGIITIFASTSIVGKRSLALVDEVVQSDLDLSKFDPKRVAIWTCGVQIGMEAPIFGRGHDEALDEMKSCTSNSFERALRFSHFHNLFVDQFAKAGGVGLFPAIFLWLLPVLLLICTRYHKAVSPTLTAGILGIWSVQTTGALFNIGFGHDAVDAGFIYTNALLFGVINARFRCEAAPET